MNNTENPYQVRGASINAYKWLQAGGKIGERQLQVFNIFVNFGPMSAKMMHKIYESKYGDIPVDSVSPRISELKEMGMLAPVEKDKCTVTGCLVDFSRAAHPDEEIDPTTSTKAQTKKVLESSLELVKLWRGRGSLQDKHDQLDIMEGLLEHFYPEEISRLHPKAPALADDS